MKQTPLHGLAFLCEMTILHNKCVLKFARSGEEWRGDVYGYFGTRPDDGHKAMLSTENRHPGQKGQMAGEARNSVKNESGSTKWPKAELENGPR